jgi:hypothetical protein
MNNYFELATNQQQYLLEQATGKVGLPPHAIEKDIWVTTILQIVFTLPFADRLIFKGGTSLSKVWGTISRFSEDIDLAVDRSLFDIEGEITKKKIKKLRKASSVFVREDFKDALQQALDKYGLSKFCTLEAEADGEGDNTYPEPRKLFIKYKSVLGTQLGYNTPQNLDNTAKNLLSSQKTNFELCQKKSSQLLSRQKLLWQPFRKRRLSQSWQRSIL